MTMADCHTYLVKLIGLHLSLDEFVAAKYAHYLRQAPGFEDASGRTGGHRSLAGARRGDGDRLQFRPHAGVRLPVPSACNGPTRCRLAGDVRLGKPHAEPYLRAAYLLDLKPEDCIVEDSAPGAKGRSRRRHARHRLAGKAPAGHYFPRSVVMADPDDITPVLAACLSETFVPQL